MKSKDQAGMSKVWIFLRACRRRLFAREALFCALTLSPGSFVIMLNLPVLWRDYDGFGQITAPPGHLTILAFPPLYPSSAGCRFCLCQLYRDWPTHIRSRSTSIDQSC